MEYNCPLLESFFTEEKKDEILAELQENASGGEEWKEFFFIFQAKAFYEEEITNAFSDVLRDFFCGLIDLNRDEILLKLLSISTRGATYATCCDDLCPLSYAIDQNKNEIAKMMIDCLQIEELENTRGIVPGCVAISNENLAMVRYLLDKGVDTRSFAGWYSGLQFAIYRLKLDIVDLLICEYNVDVNETGNYEYPPLTMAVKSDLYDLVKLLLDQDGIAVNQMDAQGWRAIDYARSDGVRELLLHAGAKETPEYAKALCKIYFTLDEDEEYEAAQLTSEYVSMPGATAQYEQFDLFKLAFWHDNFAIVKLLLENDLVDLSSYNYNLVRHLFYVGLSYRDPSEEILRSIKYLKLLSEKGYKYPLPLTSTLRKMDCMRIHEAVELIPQDKRAVYLVPILVYLKRIEFEL